MKEIRNLDGKLVCVIKNNIVEIIKKDCITRIQLDIDKKLKITNNRITEI